MARHDDEQPSSRADTAIQTRIFRHFCKSVAEIQWLLVILVMLYLVLRDGSAEPPTAPVLITIAVYFGLSFGANRVDFLDRNQQFLIAVHTLAMMAFVTTVIYLTDSVGGPLVGLYLLAVITSALALSLWATLLEVIAVAACYLLLIQYSEMGFAVGAHKLSIVVANILIFFLVGYLTTTLANAIRGANEHLQAIPRLEQSMAAAVERWQHMIERSVDAFIEFDSAGRVTQWNPQATTMFGWRQDEAIGRTVDELVFPQKYRLVQSDRLQHFLVEDLPKTLDRRFETELVNKQGMVHPVEVMIHGVKMPDQWYYDAFVHDISKRRQQHSSLLQKAHRDAVTQLANRHAFEERLSAALGSDSNTGDKVLIMIDLDGFKAVNDTHGHEIGDQLLKLVGQRIADTVRGDDLVARLGGDEFVVLMEPEHASQSLLERVGRQIVATLSERYRLSRLDLTVTASVGIATGNADSTNPVALLRRADEAMYAAKRAGKNQFRIADDRPRPARTASN